MTSKSVTALRSRPRIDDIYFELVREKLDGTGVLDPHKKKYDSGKHRLTHVDDWLGMGRSHDRLHSPGVGMGLGQEEGREDLANKERGLSSWYNLDKEGPVQDDIGPGYTPTAPDPDYTIRTNELFLDKELYNRDTDDASNAVKKNLKKVIDGPEVVKPHIRVPVDRRMK